MTTPAPDPYAGDLEPPERRAPEAAAPSRSRMRLLRPRRATAWGVAAVVLALAWAWTVSENAREHWWDGGEHVALTPSEDSWAAAGPVRVHLLGAEAVDVPGESPPDGFGYYEIVLAVTVDDVTSRSCEVEVATADGRLFLAGEEVPDGDDAYVSSLTCGTSDPSEEPVPSSESLLVLLPEDAEPVAVRVDAPDFPAASFVEFRLG